MSEFEKERERQIAERLREMPKSQRANYLKAQEGKSRCAAMKAKCLDCMGYKIEEVRQCTDLACSHYLYRPYQNGHKNETDDQDGQKGGQCDE